MWTCPECGRSFANTNQAHACQTTTVDDYLAEKSDLAVAIYQRVVSVLDTAGAFRVHAQRTRIGFISRMTFAGISLAREWADLTFILPKPLDDERIRRLELYGPTSWGHHIRLQSVQAVDDEVTKWLGDALRRGDQETLDPRAEVTPLNERQLAVFWTGFRGRVSDGRVALPGHVSDALAAVDEVVARVSGTDHLVELIRVGGSTLIEIDGYTSDQGAVDVFLRAAR